MKIIKLLTIATLPLLISCNMVSFESPMPTDGKTLKYFGKSLTGNYYITDSIFDEDTYNEKYYPEIYKTKDSVKTVFVSVDVTESTVMYTGVEKSYYDTTKLDMSEISLEPVRKKEHESVERKNINKYVLIETTTSEVIVNLSAKDVLKQKGKIYYVNKNNENDWYTFQIIKEKNNSITINSLSGTDVEKLPKEFNVEIQPLSTYMKNVTPERFNYLVEHHYFSKFFSLKKK